MIKRRRIGIFILSMILCGKMIIAQTAVLFGKILVEDGKPIRDALVIIKSTQEISEIDEDGWYKIKNIPFGTDTVFVVGIGMQSVKKQVVLNKSEVRVDLLLPTVPMLELDEVVIRPEEEKALSILKLHSIQNFTVYEGKKNEVVLLKNMAVNTATNNARQIFGTITGLNIWESDGGGLQLGIGGRGLSPNRTSNFNTRQSGYDISADVLGYPESYYTPASEAIEKIEVIRGASALQYGTQFGGTVNFQFKKGNIDTPFEYIGRQTLGSWNFINSFNSLGGTSKDQKINYYTFYQRKVGDGWRPNSSFKWNNAYTQCGYRITPKTVLGLEYTYMDYLAKQAGGLTDAMFKTQARQSVRNRNWFKVNWNLLALTLTHKFSLYTHLNIRNFGLLAQRQSLGNLERINVVDFNQNRTLIDGQFKNVGSEIRLVHRYKLGGTRDQAILAGIRVYAGCTTALQGDGDSLSGPNFRFLNLDNVEGSDYTFPNYNFSMFAEHIFKLNEKLSVTPGIRYENIQTFSSGYYRQRVFDFAGNIVVDRKIEEDLNRKRSFVITGIGISYKAKPALEIYSNITQNYRAINFTDLRIQNPNFVIDSNLTDEKGFTADFGIRGGVSGFWNYEMTAFYLYYNNRIGQILKADQPPLFLDYRLRTNIAASRNIGLESFTSINIARFLPNIVSGTDWIIFVNASVLDARYIKSKDASIQGKEVEMVPPFIIRSGTTYKAKNWKVGFQINYVARHYSDATNAILTSTAVEGIIPAYTIADISASYQWKKWLGFELSCNNLFDAKYYTRRAESYPGPGIIPSDGRSFYVTLEFKLSHHRKK